MDAVSIKSPASGGHSGSVASSGTGSAASGSAEPGFSFLDIFTALFPVEGIDLELPPDGSLAMNLQDLLSGDSGTMPPEIQDLLRDISSELDPEESSLLSLLSGLEQKIMNSPDFGSDSIDFLSRIADFKSVFTEIPVESKATQDATFDDAQLNAIFTQISKTSDAEMAQIEQPMKLDMQNRAGFGDGLGEKLSLMLGSKVQSADIRLDPPNLGSIEIKIKVEGDKASVIFHSPHGAVRDAVSESIPRLREMLSEQGISLGDVTVSSGQQQGQGSSGSPSRSPGSASEDSFLSSDPVQPDFSHRSISRDGLVDFFV